jgi:hypothetical protein
VMVPRHAPTLSCWRPSRMSEFTVAESQLYIRKWLLTNMEQHHSVPRPGHSDPCRHYGPASARILLPDPHRELPRLRDRKQHGLCLPGRL